jgi:hypothetical protein
LIVQKHIIFLQEGIARMKMDCLLAQVGEVEQQLLFAILYTDTKPEHTLAGAKSIKHPT